MLAERWSEWIQNSSPRLGKIVQMIRVASGEIYVRLMILPEMELTQRWTGPRELQIMRSALESARMVTVDRTLEEMALTHVTLSARGDQIAFTVRQSTLG